MWHNYDTSFPQLGRNIHSKVYLLSKAFLNDKIVVKIYEKERQKYFKNEKKILDILNNKYENNENNNENKNNNFFPMYKEILYNFNLFKIPKEIKGGDLEFLFFDYLPNLSLLDYIIDIKKGIKEIHIKFLCYKLLLAIKNLREKNICHNAINISNILFDENYNPKIIHFSEANIIEKKTLLNNDFFRLGQTIAKIISFGKLESIIYNKKSKRFKIKLFNQEKLEDESKFWKKLKINDDNIVISEQFINFFHLLIYSKISNNKIDIDEIMKNEFLNEVNNNLDAHQKNFENDFKIMKEKILEIRNEENKIEININDIINAFKKEDDHLIYNYINSDLKINPNKTIQPAFDNIINQQNIQFNYNDNSMNNSMSIIQNNISENNNIYNNMAIHNNIMPNNISFNNMNMQNNIMPNNISFNNMAMHNNIMQNNISFNNMNMNNQNNMDMGINNYTYNSDTINMNNINNINSNNNIMMNNNNNYNKLMNDNEEYLSGNQIDMRKDNMDMIKYNNMTNNYNMDYFNKNISLNQRMQNYLKSKITKNNYYNILELNIKNFDKTEQEIKNALIFFMKTFRGELITKLHILVDSVNEENISFIINGFILPYNYDDYDEIIFLDEKFEQIAKFGLKYQIEVKIIKKFINKYYMIFSGINIDKEYFYRHIKDFKDIAKTLLKGKYINNNYLLE